MGMRRGSKRTPASMRKIIEEDGWQFIRQKGSHQQFKHPIKHGRVSIPCHGFSRNVELSIYRQAGLEEKKVW